MSRTTLVVADAARARVYLFDPGSDPVDHAPPLLELTDLVNPERSMRPRERHGDRPGREVAASGVAFGVDDHRERHEEELDRQFAARVATQLVATLDASSSQRAIVVAPPHFLGLMRPRLVTLPARGVELHELALDLTHESTPALVERLERAHLIPASGASAS